MTPKEILNLFDEKYDRLESSSLIRFMSNPGWKFSFDFKTNELKSDAIFPDLENVESYILNLRFFIQDNEPISLHNLMKFYEVHSCDIEKNEKFSELRNILNSEFDKSWPFLFNGKQLSFRNIFEGFIYSKFAHSKVKNHEIFNDLTKHSFGYYLAFDYFLRCISLIQDILTMIKHLNKTTFSTLKLN